MQQKDDLIGLPAKLAIQSKVFILNKSSFFQLIYFISRYQIAMFAYINCIFPIAEFQINLMDDLSKFRKKNKIASILIEFLMQTGM